MVVRYNEARLSKKQVERKVCDRLVCLASHEEREAGERSDRRHKKLLRANTAVRQIIDQFRIDSADEFALPERRHGVE